MLIWEIIIVFLVFGYKGAFYPQKKRKTGGVISPKNESMLLFLGSLN